MPRDDDSVVGVDELVAVLREHEGPSRPTTNGPPRRSPTRHKRTRLRRSAFVAVPVVLALLVGSGLGFGLGSTVTPSGTARPAVVGFGFVPARGWNVVQSGAIDSSGAARAIAANVPIASIDEGRQIPLATLTSLPARGVVIVTKFTPRGDPGEDFKFVASELPLSIEAARRSPDRVVLGERRLGQYRLRAGIGGYNADAQIYFGTEAPAAPILASAQEQLNRLVVASDRITIAARPSVARWIGGAGTRAAVVVTLFGSTQGDKPGEPIEIQAKDCGQTFFRVVAGTSTIDGGGWSLEYFPAITTTLRAVWNGEASTQITVRQRALATLRRVRPGLFEVSTTGRTSFWRKRMLIQQFDRRLGQWRALRSVLLTTQEGGSISGASFSGRVRLSVPKGTQLRSVLPQSQAGRCYLSGTSLPVRA